MILLLFSACFIFKTPQEMGIYQSADKTSTMICGQSILVNDLTRSDRELTIVFKEQLEHRKSCPDYKEKD